VAYRLELPPTLEGVHNVFHVSQLKKCLEPSMDVVVNDVASIDADLSYPEHPVKVLGQQDQVTRCQTIRLFKVQWSHHSEQEATWETEEFHCSKYPEFSLRSDAYATSLAPPLADLNLRVRFL
jgi:hypothetical protein